ncbi:kinase-like protein [Exidia glandulosa HHB12029]|uniref:Kinase-like protein n=1 Tax=Exidia glandulosa HHB12029 TaxID=1314781 RepID=A0A165NDE5_EXIGL|nr:kinase-like protein [Exidia glandulosa HHB12029]
MSADDLSARITAPFGAWPNDLDHYNPSRCRRLTVSEHAIVNATEHDKLVVKTFHSLPEADVSPTAIREMRMMLLSGEDVSVRLEGRLLRGSRIEGFVMPYEQPLEAELASASAETKVQWIEQLQALVSRVHAKGILHGDIKPDNVLVRKSDGQLVLCDWAAAQMQSEAVAPREGTSAYQSPWRCRDFDLPLCKQDDLYALGVSIWHIWQGRAPFDPEMHEYLDDDIADGLQPNLDEVDNATVRALIERYLKAAPSVPNIDDSDHVE